MKTKKPYLNILPLSAEKSLQEVALRQPLFFFMNRNGFCSFLNKQINNLNHKKLYSNE